MNKKILFMLAAASVMVACNQKGNDPEDQTEGETLVIPAVDTTKIVKEDAFALTFPALAFNGNFMTAADALVSNPYSPTKKMAAYATASDTFPQITFAATNGDYPVSYAVNFGSENILAPDGLKHAGVMTLTASAPYEQEGCNVTLGLDKFYVYGHHITGTQLIQNTGSNAAGHSVYKVTVKDGAIADGGVSYTETTNRELVAGDVSNFLSHTYSITGTMTMKDQKSDTTVTMTITDDPMVIAVGDYMPTSGTAHLTISPALTFDPSAYGITLPAGFAISISSTDVKFLGRNDDGSYNVSASFTILTMTFTLTFAVDETGIIQDSIKVS